VFIHVHAGHHQHSVHHAYHWELHRRKHGYRYHQSLRRGRRRRRGGYLTRAVRAG
jgi:hypothetical protein